MSGEEVKKILTARGIKLASLARMMDISAQNLHGILKAKDISSSRLNEISNLTNIEFIINSPEYVKEPDPLSYFSKTTKPIRNLNDINEIDYLHQLLKDKERIILLLEEQLKTCTDNLKRGIDHRKSKAS